MENDGLKNCVLKGCISACLQETCKYWDQENEVCTRQVSTAADRRERQRAEAAEITGGARE